MSWITVHCWINPLSSWALLVDDWLVRPYMLSYMVSYEYTAAAQHECTVAACSVGSEVI